MLNKSEKRKNKKFVIGSMALTAVLIVIGCVILAECIDTQAAPAEPSYKYYKNIQVQKGDTLWDIAHIYITDDYHDMYDYIDEVCAINHISDARIREGEFIIIPYYSKEYLQ